MKKILVVDDSALMRRVLCDIINKDERFEVTGTAANGREALELLRRNRYDAVVLDVNMPEMDGLQLLKELRGNKISARVMMASTATKEGAQTTLTALELGALDFVHKPSAVGLRLDLFGNKLLMTLEAVASAKLPTFDAGVKPSVKPSVEKPAKNSVPSASPIVSATPIIPVSYGNAGNAVVAIASSTGGPKALQSVIPKLSRRLNAPVLVVQHMPKGFTSSLAERLNDLSELKVKEAVEGEELQKGVVYVAMGGVHMKVVSQSGGRNRIHYTDEPLREGVRPCANYMYESLANSGFARVVCVVMTGMGADGTAGIRSLKQSKPVHVIAQDQASCVVYGMPKSIEDAALADRVVSLEHIAEEVTAQVGLA